MKYTFVIHNNSGEIAAGIRPFDDEVTVDIGDYWPDGLDTDQIELLRSSLAECFDCTCVTKEEWDKAIEEENKIWREALGEEGGA